MCDLGPFRNWLLGVAAAIAVAIGFIVAAAIANASFWGAAGSPVLMGFAAAAGYLAVYLLGQAQDALNAYATCTGDRCAGAVANMTNVITAVRVVLGIQSSACLAAAFIAWIPYGGAAVMGIILASFILQALLIATALLVLDQLRRCALPPAITRPPGIDLDGSTVGSPLTGIKRK
jgi:hypothetical protein